MADWREIMEQADQAKCQMIVDQARGEQMFSDLILRVGNDGMIYFKRAEAYEALEKFDLAQADFRKALAYFPIDRWKKAAREGINRVDQEII